MTTTNAGKKRKAKTPVVEESCGNVFEDLGLPDAKEALYKSDLTHQICAIIKARKLTQAQAAAVLGVDQPKVSALVRGRLDQFSIDRLIRFLNRLGHDVEIIVRPGPERA